MFPPLFLLVSFRGTRSVNPEVRSNDSHLEFPGSMLRIAPE